MSTFNAGAIEASLTLDRSSWNRDLKELQAQIEKLEQTRIDIAVGMDADEFHRAAAQIELSSDQLGSMAPEIKVTMDADEFHRAAAQIELTTELLDNENVEVGIETAGMPKTMAELADLQVAIEAADANDVTVNVDYDRNKFQELVGNSASGSSGGGGYMGLFHILLVAGIALAPVLSVAISVLSAQIVAFTAAVFGALGPLALLIGAIVVLMGEYKKAQQAGESLGPGMDMLAQQIKHLQDFIHDFARSDTGQQVFAAMAIGIHALLSALTALEPVINAAAGWFEAVATNLDRFANSEGFKQWVRFFGGFGIQMLNFFTSILSNLIQFLFNLFQAIRPFATRMMGGLTSDLADLAKWSENIGKDKGFQDWMQTATEFAPLLGTMLKELIEAFIAIGDAIRPFARPMIEAITAIAEAIQSIPTPILTIIIGVLAGLYVAANVLLPVLSALATVGEVIAGAFAADAVAFGLALGPILLIIAAAAALAAILVYLWNTNEDFRQKVIESWNQIKQTVMPIVDAIVSTIREHWSDIQQWTSETFHQIADIVHQAMIIIHQLIFFATQAIQFIWRHFGDIMIKQLVNVFQTIGGVVRGALQILQGIFRLFADILTGRWGRLWDDVKLILRGAWTIITSLVRGSFNTVVNLFTAIGRALAGAWHALWNGIVNVAQAAWGHIRDGWNNFIGWLSGIPGRVAGALGGMWDGIVSGFRSAINTVVGWWNSLHFHIPGFNPPGPGSFGGMDVGVSPLPTFATGAVVDEPTIAMVGDADTPEIITPERKMADIVKRFGGVDHKALAAAIVDAIRPLLGEGITKEMLEAIMEKVAPNVRVDASNDDKSARAIASEIGWELRLLGYGGGR